MTQGEFTTKRFDSILVPKKRIQTRVVVVIAKMVPMGMDFWASRRSPDLLEPAMMPSKHKVNSMVTFHVKCLCSRCNSQAILNSTAYSLLFNTKILQSNCIRPLTIARGRLACGRREENANQQHEGRGDVCGHVHAKVLHGAVGVHWREAILLQDLPFVHVVAP